MCNHKPDGLVYLSYPPQYRCKICGEFYGKNEYIEVEGLEIKKDDGLIITPNKSKIGE